MPISGEAFESWTHRNGRETFEEEERPGIICWFPDADISDRIHYFPDTDTFDVIAGGPFYSARSVLQHAESWIDDRDRLHIDTDDTRLVVDPR